MAAEPDAFLVPPPPSSSSPVPGERGGDGITPPPPETPRPRNGFRSTGGGKRRSSCGAKQPAWKRRRRAGSECGPVLPSEFLLGGNIFDPLNLNSLLDEEVSRALNARTPQSSPLPARGRDPVEILVPRDITDPLSLNVPGEGLRLASPAKSSRRRHRHRGQQRNSHKQDGGGGKSDGKSSSNGDKTNKTNWNGSKPNRSNGKTNANASKSGLVNRSNANVNKSNDVGNRSNANVNKSSSNGEKSNSNGEKSNSNGEKSNGSGDKSIKSGDKSIKSGDKSIKSDSGGDDGDVKGVNTSQRHRKRRRTCSKSEGAAWKSTGRPPRRQAQKFQYGNYCKYYGYRNPDCEDGRLRAMKGEWFEGKEVLDVGCNVGHVTLSIAKRWGPARVVGLDIDGGLIRSARQNIRHYLSEELGGKEKGFPAALAASRGPIAAPRLPPDGPGAKEFPNNVVFVTGNYVPEREDLIRTQRPEFDVVLCLSLTKWVQLNWGDEGLKRLFRRVYRHLRPGGVLLLEPQPWASYRKRKTLTETIYRNYQRIRLRPEQFPAYLTSPEVGFDSYELLGTPQHAAKGFQRPLYLFHKGRSDTP